MGHPPIPNQSPGHPSTETLTNEGCPTRRFYAWGFDPNRGNRSAQRTKTGNNEIKSPALEKRQGRGTQVHNANSEWTYGSSIRTWSGQGFAECRGAGHPPFYLHGLVFECLVFALVVEGARRPYHRGIPKDKSIPLLGRMLVSNFILSY